MAEWSSWILQAFGDNAVNARHWFQKLMSRDMTLCDEAWFHLSGYVNSQNNRPHWPAIGPGWWGPESLRRGQESDMWSAWKSFRVSDETFKLHLHHILGTFKLSKWVLYTLLEAKKQQRVSASFSLLSWNRNAPIFDRVPQDHPYIHDRSCSVSGELIAKWCTMNCYQRAKKSLCTVLTAVGTWNWTGNETEAACIN